MKTMRYKYSCTAHAVLLSARAHTMNYVWHLEYVLQVIPNEIHGNHYYAISNSIII